jgi:hypothetical protein
VHPVAVELDEGARVEQQLDALPRGELAALALALDCLLRSRVGRRLAQAFETLDLPRGRAFPKPLTLHSSRHSSTQQKANFRDDPPGVRPPEARIRR